MKSKLVKAAAIIALVLITAVLTWKATIMTASVSVEGRTAYVTAWGQTDSYIIEEAAR